MARGGAGPDDAADQLPVQAVRCAEGVDQFVDAARAGREFGDDPDPQRCGEDHCEVQRLAAIAAGHGGVGGRAQRQNQGSSEAAKGERRTTGKLVNVHGGSCQKYFTIWTQKRPERSGAEVATRTLRTAASPPIGGKLGVAQ